MENGIITEATCNDFFFYFQPIILDMGYFSKTINKIRNLINVLKTCMNQQNIIFQHYHSLYGYGMHWCNEVLLCDMSTLMSCILFYTDIF